MKIEIDKRFLRFDLDIGLWERRYGELDGNSYHDQNVGSIFCYFRLDLPMFRPDKKHIAWVKEAYGLNPQKPKRTVPQGVETDEDYDPIPF
ncbi:hypothetical protein [Kamptonema sp. UHCC 0994]|uniref:hypothetical protein n=1 Tax=Kamptonema sp. UHCC 0994 TaxID=3031329 RepID=UPI0023B95F13|nr:hypothetical protein [Kamptonema sp. UHCC 0994]MDF0553179.1 hypothetical protein [Kamptonema sp. UHCC 0994]